MSVAITLRSSLALSYFREAFILALRASRNARLLLCSGFYQEPDPNAWRISTDPDLLGAIRHGTQEVNTVGVHNRTWLRRYNNFVASLTTGGISVTQFRPRTLNWHAKIVILSDSENRPYFGIIGSSNMTRPAFSATNVDASMTRFNFECDVIMWRSRHRNINQVMIPFVRERVPDIIVTRYIPNINGNLSIEERLAELRARVMNDVTPISPAAG